MSCTTPPVDLQEDQRILPIMLRLAGCVEAALTSRGLLDPCFLGVVSGQAVDPSHIGENGGWMAWVRIGEMAMPTIEGGQKCGSLLQVEVEVGFLTCYPEHDDGTPLTVDENLGITTIVQAGQMALLTGIQCCGGEGAWTKYPEGTRQVDFDITRWAPVGPFGLVVGGAWFLTVTV